MSSLIYILVSDNIATWLIAIVVSNLESSGVTILGNRN